MIPTRTLLVALLAWCSSASACLSGSYFPDRYDGAIRAAAERWWPGVPWQLWKSQLYQESRLDPGARSPAGAIGIAQFMPGTAAQIFPLLGYGVIDPLMAEPSIEAGAYYMARLRAGWTAPRPWQDRHKLAEASYNAGPGNIIAAQRACGDPAAYDAIMACLPLITGRYAAETLGYAPAIWRWFAMMMTE